MRSHARTRLRRLKEKYELMQKPNTFEVKELEPNKAEIVITPLSPGYGATIGNALRRVMLSSLPGSAITAVKIKGADHEFTAIPGVKEDTIQLILNLKQVRLVSHSDEPIKLTLSKKGKGAVTAADFGKNASVEFADPSQVVANITDEKGSLDLEVTVGQGIGYSPVETRDGVPGELGEITIDAIYTPIRNVNFEKENVRVGQFTNYDKLILTVTTDGTIAPQQAVVDASQILVDQFQLLLNPEEIGAQAEPEPELEEPAAEGAEAETTELPDFEEKLGEEEPKKRGRPKKAE